MEQPASQMRNEGPAPEVVEVAVVGMGMSGVAIALKLQQAKVQPVALFEKSSELGGVWNYNTYPGAQCDIPSHLYSLKEHPEFQFGCKEVLLSSTYLKTFTKPNVHLVTSGVKHATPTGIVDSDGVSRDFDAVVFATGFRPGDFVKQMPMIGRTGETLAEEWATKGWTAYLGMACSKFPNAFLMMGPNTALGHNSHVDMIEGQAAYITSFITQMRAAGLVSGCLKEDVMEGFRQEIKQRLDRSVWSTGCHTWYFTNGAGGVSTIWPGFVSEYESRTRVAQLRDFDLVDKTGQPAKAPKAPVDWVRVQQWALLLSLVAALVALVVVFGS